MVVATPAKTTSTRTTCPTSLTCVQRTLTSARRTSASSKWFLWTPKAHPRSTPTGWCVTRAKSWFRPLTATLALLLVSVSANEKTLFTNIIGRFVLIFRLFSFFSLRLPWVQLGGLQRNFLHQHREGRWLRRLCIRLPVQLQVLRRDVEADHTDILVEQTHQGPGLLRPLH